MIRFIVSLFLILALMIAGCSSEKDSQTNNIKTTQLPQGQTTNENGQAQYVFAAYDTNGTLRQSSEWIGQQPVVINFWGTWCPPCRREVPDLVKVYNEYRDKGIEIIGIAVRDTPNKVLPYAQSNGMEWPMLMVNEEVINTFRGISSVPTTIFLDSQGREVRRFVGGRSYDEFKKAFEAIL